VRHLQSPRHKTCYSTRTERIFNERSLCHRVTKLPSIRTSTRFSDPFPPTAARSHECAEAGAPPATTKWIHPGIPTLKPVTSPASTVNDGRRASSSRRPATRSGSPDYDQCKMKHRRRRPEGIPGPGISGKKSGEKHPRQQQSFHIVHRNQQRRTQAVLSNTDYVPSKSLDSIKQIEKSDDLR